MSISTEAPTNGFAPPVSTCPACHDPGETPLIMYAVATGIQKGALSGPLADDPPNGIWILNAIGACQWFLDADPYFITYTASPVNAEMRISAAFPPDYFTSVLDPICTRLFENDHINPAITKYYGGQIYLTTMHPTDALGTRPLMDLINLEPAAETWVNPLPIDDLTTVQKFYRGRDATNIHIKYNLP